MASANAASERKTSQKATFTAALHLQTEALHNLTDSSVIISEGLTVAPAEPTLSDPLSSTLFDLFDTVICLFFRLILPLGEIQLFSSSRIEQHDHGRKHQLSL